MRNVLKPRGVIAGVAALTLCLVIGVGVTYLERGSPNMMVSFSAGGQGFPAGYINEPVAFVYPLEGSTGPYRVRITAVRLIGDGKHPLPQLLHVALSIAVCTERCLLGRVGSGPSLYGTFQQWPPVALNQIPPGKVRSTPIPIFSLHRAVAIGRVSRGHAWSLVVDVAGQRRHTSFQFSAIAVTVLWHGRTSTQFVPNSEGTLNVA